MKARSKIASAWLLVFAVFGSIGFLVWKNEAPGTPRVTAIGGQWDLNDLNWTRLNGEWSVSVIFAPGRVSLKSAEAKDLLKSLCGALMTQMPDAPRGVSRTDVFRAKINVQANDGLLFKQPIPVQIKAGACQLKGDGEFYYYQYPGALADWELYGVEIDGGSAEPPALKLAFRRAEDVDSDGLNFKAACQAYFDDGAPHLDEALEAAKQDAFPEGAKVLVQDLKMTGSRLFHFSTSQSQELIWIGGRCTDQVGQDL